jgi:cytochrome bd-type quinol oxidase subunit 1
MSVITQILIIIGSPMDNNLENMMAFFNEIMVSLYLYIMHSLTDYNEDKDYKEGTGGWMLVFVVLGTVGVNLLKLCFILIKKIILRLRRRKDSKAGGRR